MKNRLLTAALILISCITFGQTKSDTTAKELAEAIVTAGKRTPSFSKANLAPLIIPSKPAL